MIGFSKTLAVSNKFYQTLNVRKQNDVLAKNEILFLNNELTLSTVSIELNWVFYFCQCKHSKWTCYLVSLSATPFLWHFFFRSVHIRKWNASVYIEQVPRFITNNAQMTHWKWMLKSKRRLHKFFFIFTFYEFMQFVFNDMMNCVKHISPCYFHVEWK